MNALLLITALLLAQPQAPPVRADLAAARQAAQQAPPVRKTGEYESAAAQAVKENRPLVVFVGAYFRPIKGAIICAVDALPGYPTPATVVSAPGSGWLVWRATLNGNATDAEIQAAIAPRAVQPAAIPFSAPQAAVADADFPAEVSAVLSGMERYTSTKVAQVSGNRSGNGANWTVSRLTLPAKWHQPGGLEGLTGWSNQVYRKRGNPVKTWFGHVNDWENYGGGWGSEITYQRAYGDGAKFADVLATSKGIFEVRVAEKVNGEWRRSVPYRDAAAEPNGYKRVSLQQCAGCHDQAGDGGYGTARIIGGGGVLSEPLAGLE